MSDSHCQPQACPAPPLESRRTWGPEGRALSPVGLKNLKACILFRMEAGRYFTGGRFKQENLSLNCLEERSKAEKGLRNLSRPNSDDLRCIIPINSRVFLLQDCWHFGRPGGIPGIGSGLLAGLPRANCAPLQPAGVRVPLLEVRSVTKGPCLLPLALEQISAFQDGVELMS